MLLDIFQESDHVLYMGSGADKRPQGYWFSKPGAPPLFENPVYYAINPIDPLTNLNTKGERTPRASINVTAFRNFLFEIDSLGLQTQLELLKFIQPRIPFAQVTFSGGSSYHAIVSVLDTLPFKPHTTEGISQYSEAWKALNAELTSLASEYLGSPAVHLFDQACKDPARLSRTPNSVRPDTGNVQSSVSGFGGYLSSDDVLRLMNKHAAPETQKYFTNSDGPADPLEKGQLSKRTLDFINNWKPDLAPVWPWHPDFIFAVKDLQSQNFTFEEARKILSAITGHLDSNDMYQMKDVWSRKDFMLSFRRKSS